MLALQFEVLRFWQHLPGPNHIIDGETRQHRLSSPKFSGRVAGVERSEPPGRRISGGSLTLDPGHPDPDTLNLELLRLS
jgi:hypothetical protein